MEIPNTVRRLALTGGLTAVAFVSPEIAKAQEGEGSVDPTQTKAAYCYDQVRDRSTAFNYSGVGAASARIEGDLDEQDPQCRKKAFRTSVLFDVVETDANGEVTRSISPRERLAGSGALAFSRKFKLEACKNDQATRLIAFRERFKFRYMGKGIRTQARTTGPVQQACR